MPQLHTTPVHLALSCAVDSFLQQECNFSMVPFPVTQALKPGYTRPDFLTRTHGSKLGLPGSTSSSRTHASKPGCTRPDVLPKDSCLQTWVHTA